MSRVVYGVEFNPLKQFLEWFVDQFSVKDT